MQRRISFARYISYEMIGDRHRLDGAVGMHAPRFDMHVDGG